MYESNKDGGREIEDKEGNIQTKRDWKITEREREKKRKRGD